MIAISREFIHARLSIAPAHGHSRNRGIRSHSSRKRRPLVDRPRMSAEDIEEAWTRKAVVVGVPVRDTIKMISETRQVISTPARDCLWEIQTPQAFERSLIVEAYEAAERNNLHGTDDAMLVERLGKPVYLIEGEPTNIKITVPEDLLFAEALARKRKLD